MRTPHRRSIMKAGLAGAAVAGLDSGSAPAAPASIPTRPFAGGKARVSILGLGGSHLGDIKDEGEAVRLVHKAIDGGITFMDNAWCYKKGRSEELMGKALGQGGYRKRAFLMSKLCSHQGDRWTKAECLAILDETLRRLQTDHLDLWQLHDVRTPEQVDKANAPGAALEALAAAKKAGKVRFIGFTGHNTPKVHLQLLATKFPFDAVQMPLNVMDAHYKSFEQQVLPLLLERKISVLGMKPLGGGHGTAKIVETNTVSAVDALRYAMSLPVATTITGIENLERLDQALALGRGWKKPLPKAQMTALLDRTRETALSGKVEWYKRV